MAEGRNALPSHHPPSPASSRGRLRPRTRVPDMMCNPLRSICRIALAIALSLAAVSAGAQQYPTRPIRFVQGFAAGGNADVITRVLGAEMSKSLGQPVIFDARVGAGGNIAAEQVARAQPDGYTLLLITTAHLVSPALYNSLGYDSISDFAVHLVRDQRSVLHREPCGIALQNHQGFRRRGESKARHVDHRHRGRGNRTAYGHGAVRIRDGDQGLARAISRRFGSGDGAARQHRGCHRDAGYGRLRQYPRRQLPRARGDLIRALARPERRPHRRGDRFTGLRNDRLDWRRHHAWCAATDHRSAEPGHPPRDRVTGHPGAVAGPRRFSEKQHPRRGDRAGENGDSASGRTWRKRPEFPNASAPSRP